MATATQAKRKAAHPLLPYHIVLTATVALLMREPESREQLITLLRSCAERNLLAVHEHVSAGTDLGDR